MARSDDGVRGLEDISPYFFSSSTFTNGTISVDDQQQAAHCPICLMKFKEPRRLQCDHTFCRTCLNSVFEQQQMEREENYCLICQQQVELPPSGVDGLDSVIFVYSLRGIIPRMREGPSSSVKCSKCHGNQCLSCIRVVCNKCERYFATRICTKCQIYMCGRCADDHLAARTSHSTISIKEDVEIKEREIHDAQVAVMNGGGLLVQQTLREKEDEEPGEGDGRSSSSRGSADEQEPMDQTRLNELVNETVHVDSGEEIELIAPQNQRRPGRTSVASHAEVYDDEPTLPESYFEMGGLKICAKLLLGLVVILILTTIVFAVFVSVAVLLSLNNTNSWIYPGEAVQVTNVQPFWALEVTVNADPPYNDSYQYQSDLYYFKCSEIPTVTSTSMTFHTGVQEKNPQNFSVFLPTATDGKSLYLLPSSQMNFSILLYSETTYKECASQLILYSNYDDYLQENSLNAAFSHCVHQAASATDSPATFSYMVSSPGFYFPVLYVPPETSYSAQISMARLTYDALSIAGMELDSQQLIFTEGTRIEERTFTLTEEAIVVSDAHYCIVSITTSTLSNATPSYVKLNVSASPNIFRNISYILITIPMVFYFPVCLGLFLCCKCSRYCIRKCHNKVKTREITTI